MRAILAAGVALPAPPSPSRGGVTGRGGLDAVAVSADGKWIAVGGQNRVVYLLDADTLEVKKRIHLGARIGGLAFSRDGTRLVIEDETDTLHLMDTATAKVVAKLPEPERHARRPRRRAGDRPRPVGPARGRACAASRRRSSRAWA